MVGWVFGNLGISKYLLNSSLVLVLVPSFVTSSRSHPLMPYVHMCLPTYPRCLIRPPEIWLYNTALEIMYYSVLPVASLILTLIRSQFSYLPR